MKSIYYFNKYLFFLFLLLFSILNYCFAQTEVTTDNDYYKEDFLRYRDYIYKDNIKTVLLHRKSWELSPPLIIFNSDERLELSFDDLDAGVKDYKYTVVHCDAFWRPSNIQTYEYIEGFTEDYIDDYEFSYNTTQEYTHYSLIFPTQDQRITKSGNYILKVFIGDNIDDVAFTRRFMLLEPKINIKARIKMATNINDRNYKQEVDFTIYKQGYQIINPYKDLKVVMTQNGRWDNAKKNLTPKMIKNDELYYDYDEENVFKGGNEFRHFDIKSLKYQSERIKKIEYDTLGNQIYLHDDQRRTYKVYTTEKDINGQRLIKTEDGSNSNIEADYTYVHFFLPYSAPLVHGALYIMGALTDWQFDGESMMKYNYKKHGYEAAIYLKQGYYNYQYIFLENGKTVGDVSFIEGNHFETQNNYTIYVYYREPGKLYDKLIGVEKLN